MGQKPPYGPHSDEDEDKIIVELNSSQEQPDNVTDITIPKK
jgi:hypothetical protein